MGRLVDPTGCSPAGSWWTGEGHWRTEIGRVSGPNRVLTCRQLVASGRLLRFGSLSHATIAP
eukprot:9053157-Pyramimonas_sp.AAC.1